MRCSDGWHFYIDVDARDGIPHFVQSYPTQFNTVTILTTSNALAAPPLLAIDVSSGICTVVHHQVQNILKSEQASTAMCSSDQLRLLVQQSLYFMRSSAIGGSMQETYALSPSNIDHASTGYPIMAASDANVERFSGREVSEDGGGALMTTNRRSMCSPPVEYVPDPRHHVVHATLAL